MHTVKWFQVLLSNSHNVTRVICLHTVCSVGPLHRTLSSATTPDQTWSGSNGNEGILHIPQISDCLMSYPGHSLGGFLSLYRVAVGVFYSPSRLGSKDLKMWRTVKEINFTPYWKWMVGKGNLRPMKISEESVCWIPRWLFWRNLVLYTLVCYVLVKYSPDTFRKYLAHLV